MLPRQVFSMGDATGVCHRIFLVEAAREQVPEKANDALRDKNLEFAIEKKLPDAAKAFAAETQKSAGTLSLEQEAQSIRSSYRQVNGRFRDESGAVVKQCERCGVGPREEGLRRHVGAPRRPRARRADRRHHLQARHELSALQLPRSAELVVVARLGRPVRHRPAHRGADGGGGGETDFGGGGADAAASACVGQSRALRRA